jgi:hypothetical protein
MKLEILINIKMDKSTESVATGSEISTTNNNNNDSSNNTNDDNNDDDESTPLASHNLQINLAKPDKHNTPIKEPLIVPSRNSPSPEGIVILIITIDLITIFNQCKWATCGTFR